MKQLDDHFHKEIAKIKNNCRNVNGFDYLKRLLNRNYLHIKNTIKIKVSAGRFVSLSIIFLDFLGLLYYNESQLKQ
ncbi:MAG: hypothetical protein DWQ10_00165 [Calditrichaeota bacterium]|nr:MAG: hypothetical protein DWQ10_00165 [Calditrichota bacterium]